MGKKEIPKRHNSLRSLFGDRFTTESFPGRRGRSDISRVFRDIKGFTLVEIIIVTALISVFLAGAIAVLDPIGQIQKGNDARRKSDLAQIQEALETHYNDFNAFPAHSTTSPTYRISYSGTKDWGASWLPYMNKLPKDPKGGRNYIYYSTGQSYYLYASLERGSKDAQVCNPDNNPTTDDKCTNAPLAASCGTGVVCNYGVSSSNVNP